MSVEDYKMPFGTYRNKTLQTIYECDPSYLCWCRDRLDNPSIKELIRHFLKKKDQEIIERGKKDDGCSPKAQRERRFEGHS